MLSPQCGWGWGGGGGVDLGEEPPSSLPSAQTLSRSSSAPQVAIAASEVQSVFSYYRMYPLTLECILLPPQAAISASEACAGTSGWEGRVHKERGYSSTYSTHAESARQGQRSRETNEVVEIVDEDSDEQLRFACCHCVGVGVGVGVGVRECECVCKTSEVVEIEDVDRDEQLSTEVCLLPLYT